MEILGNRGTMASLKNGHPAWIALIRAISHHSKFRLSIAWDAQHLQISKRGGPPDCSEEESSSAHYRTPQSLKWLSTARLHPSCKRLLAELPGLDKNPQSERALHSFKLHLRSPGHRLMQCLGSYRNWVTGEIQAFYSREKASQE